MGCFTSKNEQAVQTKDKKKTNTLLDAPACKAGVTAPTKQAANIQRVQELVAEFMAGRPEGYLAGVAENVKAHMLGGLIPGADCIENKAAFRKVLEDMDK